MLTDIVGVLTDTVELSVTCRFPGGKPLGITFEWADGLRVSEIHINAGAPDGGEENPEGHDSSPTADTDISDAFGISNLEPGDVLSSVNGQDVSAMSFTETVSFLRSVENDERQLQFNRQNRPNSIVTPAAADMDPESAVSEDDFTEFSDSVVLGNVSPIHAKVQRALAASVRLDAVHVNVINLSYWYKSRGELGGRKAMAVVIQQNKQSMRYESNMFVLKPREEDGELGPCRKFLSSHSSKWNAYRHCEAMMKERDANPVANKKLPAGAISPENILSTHFRVVVVSEVFYRMTNSDRVTLVYTELLKAIGSQPLLGNDGDPPGCGHRPPSRMKMGSYFGKNMCKLPLFRFILSGKRNFPLHFIIEAITPSQWKPHVYPAPLSERFGNAHLDMRALHVEKAARSKAHKSRVKTLANTAAVDRFGVTAPPMTPSNPTGHLADQDLKMASAELLGLDSEVLAASFRKKTGGVYGHFFKDLTPGVKEMVMRRYTENKQMIQREGARMKAAGKRRENMGNQNQPKTTMSIMKAKLESSKNTSDYDKGTNSEAEMLEEYLIAAKKTERAAIRLQRMYRLRAFRVAQRRFFQEEYAAITVQRYLRGRFARLYFQLLCKLVPIAVKRIIVTYRYYVQKKRLKQWFELVRKATQVIGPILKKFVRKCVASWQKKFGDAAKKIQSVLRMHIAKIHYYRLVGEQFVEIDIYWVVVRIQAFVRAMLARKRVRDVIESRLQVEIDIPSAINIQRIARGICGRRIYERKKMEHLSAIIVQKFLMRFCGQKFYLKLKQVMLEKYCALQIQRVYRGRLDREIAYHRRHKKWYAEKFIPAIIATQAIVRMHIQQKAFITLQRHHRMASCIQLAYICYRARLVYARRYREFLLRKKGTYAIKIQSIVRAFIARKIFKKKLLAVVGRRMFAAKTILRAWVNFTSTRRMNAIMVEHRAKLHHEKTQKMKSLREEILQDLSEIQEDISNAQHVIVKSRRRAKVLDDFVIEAEMRMPDLEKQMEDIEMEDVENGWGEAYGTEYEMLSQQKAMAREELRLRRVQIRNSLEEEQELVLELEDTELELDRVASNEVNSYEYLRHSEVDEIWKRLKRNRDREIRIEKSRWGIRSKRVNVIRRSKDYFHGLRDRAQKTRDIQYATTVSHEKKAKQWDKEDINVRREERKAYQDLTKDVYAYENYAGPVQATYDDVVANTLSLLRHATLDERVHRMQDHVNKKAKLEKKRKGGLTFALKPGNAVEKLSAFDFLNNPNA